MNLAPWININHPWRSTVLEENCDKYLQVLQEILFLQEVFERQLEKKCRELSFFKI